MKRSWTGQERRFVGLREGPGSLVHWWNHELYGYFSQAIDNYDFEQDGLLSLRTLALSRCEDAQPSKGCDRLADSSATTSYSVRCACQMRREGAE